MLSFLAAALAARPYPLADGRCSEYADIGAERLALEHGVTLWAYQDKHFVWLCLQPANDGMAVLDLGLDAPGLEEPLDLHVSAQLGEWPWRVEAPATPADPLWGRTTGWTGNVSPHRFTARDQGGFAHQVGKVAGRELQLSKARFGRGTWRLIVSLQFLEGDDGVHHLVDPASGSFADARTLRVR
jgi:hypothetical protein